MYEVYHNDNLSAILVHKTNITVLVCDWWLPGGPGFGSAGLDFNEYTEQRYGVGTKAKLIKQFKNLDEFKEWFTKEYFTELL